MLLSLPATAAQPTDDRCSPISASSRTVVERSTGLVPVYTVPSHSCSKIAAVLTTSMTSCSRNALRSTLSPAQRLAAGTERKRDQCSIHALGSLADAETSFVSHNIHDSTSLCMKVLLSTYITTGTHITLSSTQFPPYRLHCDLLTPSHLQLQCHFFGAQVRLSCNCMLG